MFYLPCTEVEADLGYVMDRLVILGLIDPGKSAQSINKTGGGFVTEPALAASWCNIPHKWNIIDDSHTAVFIASDRTSLQKDHDI